MKIICKARGEGKTTDAVKVAIETGAYLIVRDRRAVEYLSREYPDLRFPITFDEFLRGESVRGSFVKNFVIDDADEFIRYVCAMKGAMQIDAITLPKCNVKI